MRTRGWRAWGGAKAGRAVALVGAAGCRLARCRRGISSIEFVIVLPVFLLFLSGIIAFGSLLYVHNNMVNAAREATRRMSVAEVAPATQNPPEPGSAEWVALDYLTRWNLNFSVNAAETCTVIDANPEVAVTITVPANEAALIDLFGFFEGRTIQAAVTMRREGEDIACTSVP